MTLCIGVSFCRVIPPDAMSHCALLCSLQPDVYTLSILLSACSKINDYDRAKLYWRALQRPQGQRQGTPQCHHACLSLAVLLLMWL